MAKVSARGRSTLVEVEREMTGDSGYKYKDKRRFMSDNRVLCKSAYLSDDGKWRWGGWSVAAKGHVLDTDAASWAERKEKNGWTVIYKAE